MFDNFASYNLTEFLYQFPQFFMQSLGSSLHKIMSSTQDNFTFSFPVWMPHKSFPSIIALTKTSLYWIIVVKMNILDLLLILGKTISAFPHLVWYWMWDFHIYLSLCQGTLFLYLIFVGFFFMKGCWISLNNFPTSTG